MMNHPPGAVIQVKDLIVELEARRVLNGVTLELMRGEILGFDGRGLDATSLDGRAAGPASRERFHQEERVLGRSHGRRQAERGEDRWTEGSQRPRGVGQRRVEPRDHDRDRRPEPEGVDLGAPYGMDESGELDGELEGEQCGQGRLPPATMRYSYRRHSMAPL